MKDRLEKLREKMGVQWKELADILNISVPMLGCLRRGERNPSDKLMVRIKAIESGEVALQAQAPPGADAVICHDKLRSAPCPLCMDKAARIAELERERDFLRDQVSGLVTALAAKPTVPHAEPASGVGYGAGKNKERKEA